MPPNAQFTPDMPLALESVAKLLDYDIETIITFHGGVVTENIKERLAQISQGQA
ncbi:hypothetical protein D3C71_2095670 [compost metagenome]